MNILPAAVDPKIKACLLFYGFSSFRLLYLLHKTAQNDLKLLLKVPFSWPGAFMVYIMVTQNTSSMCKGKPSFFTTIPNYRLMLI